MRHAGRRGQRAAPWRDLIVGGVVLAVFGITLVVSSGLFTFRRAPAGPGKLVPRQSTLTWRGPEKPKSTRTGALSIDEASAKFEIENVGGWPVHIIAVQSSCGCAEPKVQPMTIEPGRLGIVEVRALPLQVGEKLAIVTLQTDSPSTPEVVLQLRLIGGRRPPFLLQAGGELTWTAGFSKTDTRTISATTVELQGSKRQPPIVKAPSSFLTVGPPAFDESPYTKPGTVQRRYVYEVRFNSDPPPGVFSDEVLVIDPWDPQHVERSIVHAETLPPLRVVPSRTVLYLAKRPESREARADFLIFTANPSLDLEVGAEGGKESPLVISPVQWVERGRRAAFSIGVKPGRMREGVFSIIVRRSSSPTERVVVPVSLRAENVQ